MGKQYNKREKRKRRKRRLKRLKARIREAMKVREQGAA